VTWRLPTRSEGGKLEPAEGRPGTLDAFGNPVVSYHGNDNLKVLHCNDPNCAGGDESITSPDPSWAGSFTSLALDASGKPVVSYYDQTNGNLKILHCGTRNCAAACIDRPGDTQCDDPLNDPDDGCTDAEELAMGFDPAAWYDFYDVPTPAKADATGANGVRNGAINLSDVLAVLAQVGLACSGVPWGARGPRTEDQA
jgi:hypothetical protein